MALPDTPTRGQGGGGGGGGGGDAPLHKSKKRQRQSASVYLMFVFLGSAATKSFSLLRDQRVDTSQLSFSSVSNVSISTNILGLELPIVSKTPPSDTGALAASISDTSTPDPTITPAPSAPATFSRATSTPIILTHARRSTTVSHLKKKRIRLNSHSHKVNLTERSGSKSRDTGKARLDFFGRPDQNCSINGSSFRFLGCGYNGHAFAVSKECDSGNISNIPTNLVVKLRSRPLDNNKTAIIGFYGSEGASKSRENRALFDRLSQGGEDKILKHIFVQLGVVDIGASDIQYAISDFNRVSTHKMRFRSMVQAPPPPQSSDQQQPQPLPIQGKIYASLDDARMISTFLGKQGSLRKEQRHYQAVRDLVFMFYYMYQRGILHCDMKLHHVMYSMTTNVTSLIDFDEHLLLPLRKLDNRKKATQMESLQQKSQLWHLLIVIANVCDFKAQREQESTHATKLGVGQCKPPGEHIFLRPSKTFGAIFDSCGFDRPMVWTDDMMNHAEATYHALANWSGLSL